MIQVMGKKVVWAFAPASYPAEPMVSLRGLVAGVVLGVQVDTGDDQRRMAEVVAHETQIGLPVAHIRACGMP